MILFRLKKIRFWGILGPPYYGIGATIRIGREILCLPYAGFFKILNKTPHIIVLKKLLLIRFFKITVG